MDVAIVRALYEGRPNDVSVLHEQGVSLDSTYAGVHTVLSWASYYGNEIIVDYCLSHECNIDYQVQVSTSYLELSVFSY